MAYNDEEEKSNEDLLSWRETKEHRKKTIRLAPSEIKHAHFAPKFRGYDQNQVDAFLEEVAWDYEKLFLENQKLEEEIRDLENKMQNFKTMESGMKETLETAQKVVINVKGNAQKEAELIINEAKAEADKLLTTARKKANNSIEITQKEVGKLKENIKKELETLKEEYTHLKSEKEIFEAKLKNMIEMHLKLLKYNKKNF